MQSRPVASTSVFPAVPPEIQSSAQTLLLAAFVERFEQKKEDAKRTLRQQVDEVVDDLFHQLYSELMRVLPSAVATTNNDSNASPNSSAQERPNILMFATGTNSLGQSVNNGCMYQASNKCSFAGTSSLQTSPLNTSTLTPAMLPQLQGRNILSSNSNPNNLPQNNDSIHMNGCVKQTFTGQTGQKRDSPSKDLTPRPQSQQIPVKHNPGNHRLSQSSSSGNSVKLELIDEDRYDDNPPETQSQQMSTVAHSQTAIPFSNELSTPSSVIITSNSSITTNATSNRLLEANVSVPGNGSTMTVSSNNGKPLVSGIRLVAAASVPTPLSGAQHDTATTMQVSRIQQLHPHITHVSAAQHHYQAPKSSHITPPTMAEQSPPLVVSVQSPPTTLGNLPPSSSMAPPLPHQAHQQHHHQATSLHPANSTPAPAHQSHVQHFDSSTSPVIVSTGSLGFINSNSLATTSGGSSTDDAQPVNLSTSATTSSYSVAPVSAAVSAPQQIPPVTTTSVSSIDEYDCPDEEYSDSDCDCEQCVGVQICKVDALLDDDHDADMSTRPLKKRLAKRARTDDSDEINNASHSADNVNNINNNNSKSNSRSPASSSGKDNNGLAGLGPGDCPPSPPMNGDFQAEDDGEEECSATFKTISIKCSQNDCLSMFKSKIERNQHLLTAHNILPYTCLAPGCNKGFDNVRQYGEHNTSEHADVSNWACPKCPKICPDHRMLCRHIYFYHQEGRFKCRKAKCNFVASFRIDVRKHSQLHTEMYACQFGCGKSFSHTHHRKRHERIHLRLKPFKCKWPNCGYSSEARSTVIRHIRIRHFNLPLTLKQQNELNIVDNRDPRDYMEILTELMN